MSAAPNEPFYVEVVSSDRGVVWRLIKKAMELPHGATVDIGKRRGLYRVEVAEATEQPI